MQDMTQGSINGHLARMAAFMLFGMMFQTLYYLVDLYFVAHVGSAAIAAVGLCGNLIMVTVALTQAPDRRHHHARRARDRRPDYPEARRVFNQSQVLAIGTGLGFVALVFAAARPIRGLAVRGRGDGTGRARLPGLVPAGDGRAVPAGRDGRGAARRRRGAGADAGPGSSRCWSTSRCARC
jgi:hypothetical protein